MGNVPSVPGFPQEFMIGQYSCSDGITSDVAEGTQWNRLYGNPAYWNGNVYTAASNAPMKQYQFQSGLLNTNAIAMSPSSYGLRGGNAVVTSNGTQNAIVWAYEKAASTQAILHAYDATDISKELWNSNVNGGRDGMGTGVSFGTPVVAAGRVIAAADNAVYVFGGVQ